MSHNGQTTIRVRFRHIGIRNQQEFDATLLEIAQAENFPAAEQCFQVDRMKFKKASGFAEVTIVGGCCENFLTRFINHPYFFEAGMA